MKVKIFLSILILAALGTIGFKSYESYRVRKKIQTIINPILAALKPQIFQYYLQNGYFPSAANILLADSGSTVADPKQYGVPRIDIITGTGKGGGMCGHLIIAIPGQLLGSDFNDSTGYLGDTNNLIYSMYYFDNNSGHINEICGTEQNAADDYKYLPYQCIYGAGSTTQAPGGSFTDASDGLC